MRHRGILRKHQPQTAPAIKKRLFFIRIDDSSLVDEGDLVGNLLHVLGMVRREKNRPLLVRQRGHQLSEYFSPGDGIKAGGGFIENEETRTARKGQQQRCSHALSVREPLNLLLCLEIEAAKKLFCVELIPLWINRANKLHVPPQGR